MNMKVIRYEIGFEVENLLRSAVSDEYLDTFLYDKERYGKSIMDNIIDDVVECSAISEDGSWNIDDVRLAIGRVFLDM